MTDNQAKAIMLPRLAPMFTAAQQVYISNRFCDFTDFRDVVIEILNDTIECLPVRGVRPYKGKTASGPIWYWIRNRKNFLPTVTEEFIEDMDYYTSVMRETMYSRRLHLCRDDLEQFGAYWSENKNENDFETEFPKLCLRAFYAVADMDDYDGARTLDENGDLPHWVEAMLREEERKTNDEWSGVIPEMDMV